ncbi:ribonuclease III [Methanobrevibacter sp.]|uniref:ribonuclease III n=1 Tax=Methanobrevibacter sp. TaxID=66852 RepID=UPI002E771EB5|nr:ribonuclease III [Methanobrevibacter sp.]MEE0939185.1 ribonuclease III [Methanobrevibacter sp.]
MNILENFGIDTENEHIYEVAFTHASYSTNHGLNYTYERLEFLGDSVLNVVVSEYLFKKYPDFEEGKLTKLRANYVCQNALIYYANELGLKNHIRLISSGDVNLTKNEIISITADVVESFIGAMFVDKGLEFAKDFIAKNIFKYIDDEKVFFTDYKSTIKEYCDANDLQIDYEILKEFGVPHDKTFIVAILLDGEEFGVGKGKNKKEGEQAASKVALERLNIGV